MDDIVKQALRKWPNVPHCFGWLGLDMRGNWWLRDTTTQAAGNFSDSKGTLLTHEKLRAFIDRNYDVDAQGQWFFQNGPQRVYVELESTPMVWRVHDDGSVYSHTGQSMQVQRGLLDEHGHLYLVCAGILGLVHSQDMFCAAQMIEQGLWPIEEVRKDDLPHLFNFVCNPARLSVLNVPDGTS